MEHFRTIIQICKCYKYSESDENGYYQEDYQYFKQTILRHEFILNDQNEIIDIRINYRTEETGDYEYVQDITYLRSEMNRESAEEFLRACETYSKKQN